MQKSYPNYYQVVPMYRFMFIVFMTVQGIWLHAQNPFDLKSRTNIDSIQQTVIDNSIHNPLELKSDSQENNSGPVDPGSVDKTIISPGVDTPLVERNILDTTPNNTVIIDAETPDDAQSGPQDKIIPSLKQETFNKLTDQINIKNDIVLSGESDKKINWWYYVFDSFLLLILLGAFLYDKNIFSPLRKAFVHENYLRFLYRDTYLRKPGLFIYLNILFILSLGFILFRATQYFGWASTFRDYIIIQGVVLFLFTIKHLALYLLARLVDKPFDLKFYQYWMILSAGIIGLYMIPIVLMISVLPDQYLHIAMIIISIPVVLVLIYRQSKAVIHAKFFLSKHFFQFILYFCAVEIVPAVLLADILIQN